ncbi:DNA mismatch repair protein MutS [bacterium]|nr:DNA mismatch repair protein MutS [bacterium]
MKNQEINNIKSCEVDMTSKEISPGMRQYLEIKRQNPDALLLFRLGDFYETFFEDAKLMSKVLELTLTAREGGKALGKVPLAGIPVKAINNYLEKLVAKNIKVAICEQLEDPKEVKGIVKRGVTRIITSGTITETDFLEQKSNNYICALFHDEKSDDYGFAYADISTGEFKTTQANYDLIMSELARIKPSEIVAPAIQQEIKPFQIVPETKIDLPEMIVKLYNCSKVPTSIFEENFAKNNLQAVFNNANLESFGYSQYRLGFRAAGALLAYAWENLKGAIPVFERIEPYELSEYMILDGATRKNLELIETLRGKSKYGSLLWAIDKTKTNMGARLLKSWICQPLKNVEDIIFRQNFVSELVENSSIRFKISALMENISDIQRFATRMSSGSLSPREFVGLRDSLFVLPQLLEVCSKLENNPLKNVEDYKDEIAEYAEIIKRTIIDENTPTSLKDGGLIKPGVSGELDYFRDLLSGGEKWIEEFQERERQRTGIKALKVNDNRIFGYYIEVLNSSLNLVPDTYIRKQTLSGSERYITEELKKHEDDVVSAKFKSSELEYKLFCDFREYSKEFVPTIREIAQCIAECDVFVSLAQIAAENNYCRPIIDESDDFIVKNGRHAVLEKILPLGEYVSNDLELKCNANDSTQFMILTGPNMAGKSTYMRQNALIVILAQIGAWVPCDYLKLGIVDKIYTRVGASDDLTLGQSTFMVEMVETAYILNSATQRSFILLDEIGRGTSTYDGVAIAWSVAEFIAEKIKARCIFATHYHELNVMTQKYPQIKNYRITISEENGEIEFLRKVVQGGASKSYGIQVAKMAGLPSQVVKRSMDLMNRMQKDYSNNLAVRKKSADSIPEVPQLNLFK